MVYIENMIRLLVDTSSNYLVIVISKDNIILAHYVVYAGKRMSELLLEQIDNILKSISLSVDDIDEFYAGIGPGSFTGVRIGVAMVLGLSSGSRKTVYGISSLDVEAVASGKHYLKTASFLKGDCYAVREYDFVNHVFSPYHIKEITGGMDDYHLINNCKFYCPNLFFAVQSGNLWDFRVECLPMYLRKSEAEINFDKKSLS